MQNVTERPEQYWLAGKPIRPSNKDFIALRISPSTSIEVRVQDVIQAIETKKGFSRIAIGKDCNFILKTRAIASPREQVPTETTGVYKRRERLLRPLNHANEGRVIDFRGVGQLTEWECETTGYTYCCEHIMYCQYICQRWNPRIGGFDIKVTYRECGSCENDDPECKKEIVAGRLITMDQYFDVWGWPK